MSAHETGNGENPSSVREQLPASESLGLNPFGEITPTYPPIPPSLVESLHPQLDTVGEALVQAESTVLGHIEERLQQVENAVNSVSAVVLGHIGVMLDKSEKPILQIHKKITGNIARLEGDMYGYLSQFGIPIPSIQQVKYGLASGDYFGSLDPRSVEPVFEGGTWGTTGTDPIPISPIGPLPPTPVDPLGSPPPSGNGDGSTCPFGTEPIANCTPPADAPKPEGDCWRPEYMAWICKNGVAQQYPVVGPVPYWIGPCEGAFIWKWHYDPTVAGCDQSQPPPEPVGSCDKLIVAVMTEWDSWGTYNHPELGTVLPCGSSAFMEQHASEVVCWKVNRSGQQLPGQGGGVSKFVLLPGWNPCVDSSGRVWGCTTPMSGELAKCFSKCSDTPIPGEQPPPGGVCFVPPKDDCKVDLPGKPPDPGKVGNDICKYLEESIQRIQDVEPNFTKWFGISTGSGPISGIADYIVKAITGKKEPVFSTIINGFSEWMQNTIQKLTKGVQCDRGELAIISTLQAIFKFIDKYTDIVPQQLIDLYDQLSYTVCQSKIPQPAEADLAYLRGEIDKAEWECWQKANGNLVPPAEHVMQSGRAKLDPAQLDRLYRRKFIDEPTYKKLSREAGVLNDVDMKNIHDMNQAFPTLTDVALLLMRDVANEKDYDWSEADKLFQDNYKGQVKDWYDANGVDEQLAKYQWRAHFHIPSYSMGREFLFRIRPDEYDEDIAFDKAKFRKMLIQDDWHPAYVDYMINTAYLPVSKTDSVRAYMIGAIDEDELKKRYMSVGYKPEDADFYVKFHKLNRSVQNRRVAGMPTARRLVQSYARCEMTESDFRDTIAKVVVTEEQELDAIDAAKIARKVENRRRAIKSIKRPYVLGLIDEIEVQQLMENAEIDGPCREELINAWNLDRMRRDKTLSASTLCDMISRGIITAEKYVSALIRNGYTAGDANAMLLLCGAKLSEKQQKAAETLARRLAIQAERDRKAAEKARKLAECGPPDCPKNTPGGKQSPPVQAL